MMLSRTLSDPVHFEGDWTEAEADVVEAAVAEIEDRLPSTSATAAWVAIHHVTDSTHMFAVSRIGIPTVVSAQSLTALVRGIRDLDPSGPVPSLLPTGR